MINNYYAGVLSAVFLAAGLSTTAQAALIDRGNGFLYDDVLDVTWLQDANYAATQYVATSGAQGDADGRMTWDAAQTWVSGLTYLGYSDWRLPTIAPLNGTNYNMAISYNGAADHGYANNNVATELGYMFYVNLGYQGMYDGFTYNPGHGSDASSIFGSSLRSDAAYWSGSEYVVGSEAMYFRMSDGYQARIGESNEFYAMAVRDGNVVPIPAAVWLFASGLAGLVGFGRFRKRT